MRTRRSISSLNCNNLALVSATGALAAAVLGSTAAIAQSESILYNFPSHSQPLSRPIEDNSGAFFVTVPNTAGTDSAFKISEKHGRWNGKNIFEFDKDQGNDPVAGVVADSKDVLYGVARTGGAYGFGTVYSLSAFRGRWSETVLHDFTGGADGGQPVVNLVRDKATGTLFGTTPAGGGQSNCGTVFSLVPSGGNWTFNTIYSFAGGSDGCTPGVPIHGGAQKGAYFSTTFAGGAKNAGTVFELVESNGVWSESIVYSFVGGTDGSTPVDLDIDIDTGNMFGVTGAGGTHGRGVVFELAKSGHSWTQSVLYNFTGTADGDVPEGLHFEKSTGALFGTAEFGGDYDHGTLFMLTKAGSTWSETVLHSFGAFAGDGLNPESRPVEDQRTGIIYGTTANGGQDSGGTLYAVAP